MFNLSTHSSIPVMARAFQAITRPSTFRVHSFGPLALYSTPSRIKNLVAKYRKENPGIEPSGIRDFRKFLQLIPDQLQSEPSFKKDSLPNKNLVLQMLQTPQEQLTPKQIQKTLVKIGYEIRKAEFLNRIEECLNYGGVGKPIEDAEYLVNLSSRIQKAKTSRELKALYQEIKQSAFIKHLGSFGLVLDFLILEQVELETYHYLQFKCVFSPEFLSRCTHLTQNQYCFERTKPVLLHLLASLAKEQTFFTKPPEIDFKRLYELIETAQNQVDIRKALYSDELCEKFPLKNWNVMASEIVYRTDLYFEPYRIPELLWHMFKDPEKVGVALPIDKGWIHSYVEALKIRIQWDLKNDAKSDETARYYRDLYLTSTPSTEQLRERALYEIKESLKDGRFAFYFKRMQFHIDFSEELERSNCCQN
jgi:hypothetical protein